MKFIYPLVASFCLLGLIACQDNTTETVNLGTTTIVASINKPSGSAASSRTSVDESNNKVTGINWSPLDTIGVYDASNADKNARFISTNSVAASEAEFAGYINSAPAYAYYPYNKENDSQQYGLVLGEVPQIQDYSTSNMRLMYDYKIGKPDDNTESLSFSFNHLLSLLCFTVDARNTELYYENLEQISLTFPEGTKTGGKFNVDISNGDVNWLEQPDNAQTITLNLTDMPLLGNSITTAYLNCAPFQARGKEVMISILTSNHVVSFKTTLKTDFEANSVYNFPLILSEWMNQSGTDWQMFTRPTINGFRFKAAQNNGSILSKKLKYETTTTSSLFGSKTTGETKCYTDEASTTQVMDVEGNSISGCIPYLYDFNLIPEIDFPTGSTLQIKSGDTFIDYEIGTSIDFSKTVEMKVAVGSVSRTYSIDIKNSGLPIMVINQEGGSVSWKEANLNIYSKESDFDAITGGAISVYNTDGSINLDNAVAAVRLRGNTTQTYPKKPLAIKLDKKADILNIMNGGKHKRWVLLANWKDRSIMRNAVSFDLAKIMKNTLTDGMNWNPSGKFVELVYNGTHVGNYYLCEQIKVDADRLNIQSPYDAAKNGTITEADLSKYGYLLEADDYYDEVAKFTTKNYLPFMFKDDVDANNVILNYVQNKVQQIEDYLYEGNYTKAYEMLDLKSVIDYWMLYELVINKELGHPKSVYMYIDGLGKLSAGPAWDFDWQSLPYIDNLTAGNKYETSFTPSYDKSMVEYAKAFRKKSGTPTAPLEEEDRAYMWYPLLFKDATTFRPMAKERWETVRGAFTAYATEIISMGETLTTSVKYNDEMWPANGVNREDVIGGNWGYAGDESMTFEQAYKAMSQTLLRRIEGMSFISEQKYPTINYTLK